MLPHEDLALIAALCDKIGMPWEINPYRNHAEFPWNGRSLNLAKESRHGTSDIVHEIGHWLVAAPNHRAHPRFKLNDYRTEDYYEESLASLMGILLERTLGLYWAYTWEFHSWPKCASRRDVRQNLRDLSERGLVVGLIPACLL